MRCKYGGEGGIRTLDTVLPVYPLSRRAPSAVSATSPQFFKEQPLLLSCSERSFIFPLALCQEIFENTKGKPNPRYRGAPP